VVCPCCICVKSWKVVAGFNQFISIHFLLLMSYYTYFPSCCKKWEGQEHWSEVHGVVRRIELDAPDGLPVNQAMNWPQASGVSWPPVLICNHALHREQADVCVLLLFLEAMHELILGWDSNGDNQQQLTWIF
jgi:hypothetical protein